MINIVRPCYLLGELGVKDYWATAVTHISAIFEDQLK